MTSLLSILLPELILIGTACALFMVALSSKVGARRTAPVVALLSLLAVFVLQLFRIGGVGYTQFDSFGGVNAAGDVFGTLRVAEFAQYVKLISAGMGILFVLMAWPTNEDATGNTALNFGKDSGEFFALMLLSLAGLMLVAGANDIMLLFLGIELASIPTYIMVSLSRPDPVAQEAGVKYFFLGAFAAAIMLFGFSYLYGTTGSTNLYEIMLRLHAKDGAPAGGPIDWAQRVVLTPWQTLAVVMLVAGFCFKIAAVPLHFYVGDVYQGAATPVSAFLSFVPKMAGFAALIKLLYTLGGPSWMIPEPLVKANGTGLLWILAILTMTIGNVLGILQYNVKRVLAYSSVAHTGYMLVALAALGASQYANAPAADVRAMGVQGVLFYIVAYGFMKVTAFGVLQLIPGKDGKNSAETFEDIAGQGRKHVVLGLMMATACFSLIGIPLTLGFMGKLMILKPALAAAGAKPLGGVGGGATVSAAMTWMIVITMVNVAASAAYYLRIVATMFLRTPDQAHAAHATPGPQFARPATPVLAAVVLSTAGTVMFGSLPAATELLGARGAAASNVENGIPATPRVAGGARVADSR